MSVDLIYSLAIVFYIGGFFSVVMGMYNLILALLAFNKARPFIKGNWFFIMLFMPIFFIRPEAFKEGGEVYRVKTLKGIFYGLLCAVLGAMFIYLQSEWLAVDVFSYN